MPTWEIFNTGLHRQSTGGSAPALVGERSVTAKVFWERRELERLLRLYARIVATGERRDYALDACVCFIPTACAWSATEKETPRLIQTGALQIAISMRV
jgi:hypothetical protein